jgi:hypothetical protein
MLAFWIAPAAVKDPGWRLVRMNADAAVNLEHWNAIVIRQFTLLLANR